jgi:predicted AAA+ superfamily ATPase
MVQREVESVVRLRALQVPVLTITGPRQSGKTTLCRSVFSDKAYVSLEAPDERERALADPRAFLGSFPDGAVLDEVQRVPELLSYLQALIAERDVEQPDVSARLVYGGKEGYVREAVDVVP